MSLQPIIDALKGLPAGALWGLIGALAVIYFFGALLYSLFLWNRSDGEPFELRMPFLKLKTGHRDKEKPTKPQLPEQHPPANAELPEPVDPEATQAPRRADHGEPG
ncbi:hypothetical protein ABJI51_25680 [Amycolatopsis sp. NEAU-NG30]|uniref:Uncharacterized protein n=1 Tax=Amycolatopsis melonis TaxID=3156488 RepID=A0ABV0LJL0_9PSEU